MGTPCRKVAGPCNEGDHSAEALTGLGADMRIPLGATSSADQALSEAANLLAMSCQAQQDVSRPVPRSDSSTSQTPNVTLWLRSTVSTAAARGFFSHIDDARVKR